MQPLSRRPLTRGALQAEAKEDAATKQAATKFLHRENMGAQNPIIQIQHLIRSSHQRLTADVEQDAQSGRPGEAMAGHWQLVRLHLKAWGCPPPS